MGSEFVIALVASRTQNNHGLVPEGEEEIYVSFLFVLFCRFLSLRWVVWCRFKIPSFLVMAMLGLGDLGQKEDKGKKGGSFE